MGNVKISWKREDGQALPSKAVTAVQDSGNDEMTTTGFLIISDITAYDMGKYCCVASNEGGEVVSDCAQLTVQIPPPVITKHPEDKIVSQGTTVTFNCEATSYGATTYLWKRVDGGDLGRATEVTSNILTISNPVPDDTGIYVCITSNKDGQTVSEEAVLNVIAQCPTNLSIDNGYVIFSTDSKLVAYRCFNGFRLIGDASAECIQDGRWSSSPPKCTVDSCTNINATNCAHFTNVDDQGNVLCMCKPGYRVDLSNSSNCIDVDECKLDSSLCEKECVNTEGSYYCQCPPSYALATNRSGCIECGTSRPTNDRSDGYVTRKRFNWHVQLCNSTAASDNKNVLCSGSLINDQWVLTSAECVCEGQDKSGLTVNVHKTTNCSKSLNNGTSRTVALVKCHEGYRSKVVGYNVALLKLSSPVNAVPVCLPKNSVSVNFHESVNAVTMTGWGFSPIMRYSQLYTVPNEICEKSYGGEYDISFNSICTDKHDRNGHCDTGSPLMYQVKSSLCSHTWFVLAGIANEKCQATRPYDVYTDTIGDGIYQWISQTTGLHI